MKTRKKNPTTTKSGRSKKSSALKGAGAPSRARTSRPGADIIDSSVLGVAKEHLASSRSRARRIHQPLVSHRTSFWLGVGFGIFVVGVLSLLVWQLVRVDFVEAVVIGLLP